MGNSGVQWLNSGGWSFLSTYFFSETVQFVFPVYLRPTDGRFQTADFISPLYKAFQSEISGTVLIIWPVSLSLTTGKFGSCRFWLCLLSIEAYRRENSLSINRREIPRRLCRSFRSIFHWGISRECFVYFPIYRWEISFSEGKAMRAIPLSSDRFSRLTS